MKIGDIVTIAGLGTCKIDGINGVMITVHSIHSYKIRVVPNKYVVCNWSE